MDPEAAGATPAGGEPPPHLFARVWRLGGSDYPDDTTVATLVDTVLPRIEQLPGYRGGYFLAAPGGGEIVTVTFWSSLAELHAADAVGNNSIAGTMVVTSGSSMSVEVYDVLMAQPPFEPRTGGRPVR